VTSVFISYAREDQPIASAMASVLVAKGYAVWWDWNLIAGNTFRASIETELEKADKVIVIWSPRSVASSFVIDEASLAKNAGKLIPLSVERARPPLGFGDLHTIAYDPSPGTVSAVCAALDASKQSPAPSLIGRRSRTAVRSGLILISMIVSGFAVVTVYRMPLPPLVTNFAESLGMKARQFEPVPHSYQAVPSFNCELYRELPEGHPHRIPQSDILCHDVRAADADRTMGDLYRELRSRLTTEAASALVADQRMWVGLRNLSCPVTFAELTLPAKRLNGSRIQQVSDCLKQQIEHRKAELRRRISATN
jgi:uncharacterized protein YecT (DUF1311 family)